MESATIQNLAYLAASVLFILGMKVLTHPRSAVRGNLTSAVAMLVAVVATLIYTQIISWVWIILGLAVGSVIGTVMALKVPMTGMPQMVAVFNGFGGGASLLVAGAELIRALRPATPGGAESVGDAVQATLGAQFSSAIAAAWPTSFSPSKPASSFTHSATKGSRLTGARRSGRSRPEAATKCASISWKAADRSIRNA